MSINVTNVSYLVAYTLVLHYDPQILNATSATARGSWIDNMWPGGYENISSINQGLGEVNVQVFLQSGSPPYLTGSGILLYVQFSVLTAGSSLLHLDQNQIALVNSGFNNIPFNTADGIFTTVGPQLSHPEALFTYSPNSPVIGDDVFLDASASFSPYGAITLYTWEFGDGSSALSTTQISTDHVFQNSVGQPVSGTFIVSLEVTDVVDLTNRTSKPVTVNPLSNQPPIALFTSIPVDPVAGEMITFNASVSVDPAGGSVVGATWDFGDGARAMGMAVTHIYQHPGFFNLSLVVVDNVGRNGTLQSLIAVSSAMIQLVDTFSDYGILDMGHASAQKLHATVVNTGDRAVNVYAVFLVTPRRGGTVIVSSTVMLLDVRGQADLGTVYTPSLGGRYRIVVIVYINVRSALPMDSHWVPGARGQLGFMAVG